MDLEEGDRGKILQDCIQKIREKRIKKEKGELHQKDQRGGATAGGRKGWSPLLKQKAGTGKEREKGLQKDGFRRR